MSIISERLPELLRREAYPHAASDAALIETHISWVLLAGQYVYKLKKPVDFGFLDFTTADKRRADCEAEVELNRRLCPDLYLGVVDVVDRDGQLHVGGSGKVVDAAVQMRRLPRQCMLPALLDRDAADEHLMNRIAERLASFHAQAATGAGVDEYGHVSVIEENWTENFAQMQPFIGRTISRATHDAIQAYVARFTNNSRELIEWRIRRGRIRDGHGDLHAGSVCAVRRGLYLFDCIEFNKRFRCADVAAEVAFLAMDLDHRGRADLGHAFVAEYARQSHDCELLKLLDFYKCYRAYVRGKVLSMRSAEASLAKQDAEPIALEARAYFDLAHTYAAPLAPPLLLVTMGLPASGKSTLAHAAAGRLGLVHLSSDVLRKRLAGLRPTVHQEDAFERGLYSRTMSRRTYAALKRHAARWLARGCSVVLDATYGQPRDRAALARLARRTGATLVVVLCQADEKLLRARLAERLTDPHRVSDARPELWPALRAAFRPPSELTGVVRVDTSRSVEDSVAEVVGAVRAAQAVNAVNAA